MRWIRWILALIIMYGLIWIESIHASFLWIWLSGQLFLFLLNLSSDQALSISWLLKFVVKLLSSNNFWFFSEKKLFLNFICSDFVHGYKEWESLSLRQKHHLFRSKFSITRWKRALDEMCLKHKELVKLLLLCSALRTKYMTDYLYFVLKDKKAVKDIKIHLNNGHSMFCLPWCVWCGAVVWKWFPFPWWAEPCGYSVYEHMMNYSMGNNKCFLPAHIGFLSCICYFTNSLPYAATKS